MAISIKRKSPLGDPSLKNILVEIGRNANDGEPNIDGAVFLLDSSGKVSSENDLIFFGNPEHESGAVIHLGTIEGNIEQIKIDLSKIPETIDRIEIVATVYDGDELQQDFSMSSSAFIRISETNSKLQLFNQDVQNFSIATARIIGEIYRRDTEWKFKTIGIGYSGGLAALCQQFGIEVEDSPQEDSNLQINLSLNQRMVLKPIDRIRVNWNGTGEIGFFAELSDKLIVENSIVEKLNPAYATSDLWLNSDLLTSARRILIYATASEYILSLLCPSMSAIRIRINEPKSDRFCSIVQLVKHKENFVVENITKVFENKSILADVFEFKINPPKPVENSNRTKIDGRLLFDSVHGYCNICLLRDDGKLLHIYTRIENEELDLMRHTSQVVARIVIAILGKNPSIKILDHVTKKELIRGEYDSSTIVGEFVREKDGWIFEQLDQKFDGGIDELRKKFNA